MSNKRYYSQRHFMACKMQHLKFFIAGLLPRWLVRHAAIRLISHATTGIYANTDTTEVRALTALRRWDERNV